MRGGGWFWKASYEGPIVAERFYQEGFNVAVLDYRVNTYPGKTANEDAVRAMRFLRHNAAKFNTLANKIGMMGFYAGSFLMGHCATLFDAGDSNADDPVMRASSRPDAAVLCYGAGSNICASRGLLAYDRKAQAEASKAAIERNVSPECPPFFMWQCTGADDPCNATQLADALATCGVPFELHIFPTAATAPRYPTKYIPMKRQTIPTWPIGWSYAANGCGCMDFSRAGTSKGFYPYNHTFTAFNKGSACNTSSALKKGIWQAAAKGDDA